MDVLVAPHVVNDFTLSLDAIKAYEYAATGRPIVATPTSGFDRLAEVGAQIAGGDEFLRLTQEALRHPERHRTRPVPGSDWDDRAGEFAVLLENAIR